MPISAQISQRSQMAVTAPGAETLTSSGRQRLSDDVILEAMRNLDERDRMPPRLLALSREMPSLAGPLSASFFWKPFTYRNTQPHTYAGAEYKQVYLKRLHAKCPSGRYWLDEMYTSDPPKDAAASMELERDLIRLAKVFKRGKQQNRATALDKLPEQLKERPREWTWPLWHFYLLHRQANVFTNHWFAWHKFVPPEMWKRDDFICLTATFKDAYDYWPRAKFSDDSLMRRALAAAGYRTSLT